MNHEQIVEQAIERLERDNERDAAVARSLRKVLDGLECKEDRDGMMTVLGFLAIPAGISEAYEQKYAKEQQKKAQRRMKRTLGGDGFDDLMESARWIERSMVPHPTRMDGLTTVLGLTGELDAGDCACCQPG